LSQSSTVAMIAPTPAAAQYDRRNEYEYREQVARELAQGYRKDGNVIVPYGRYLGFTGSDGSEAILEFDAGVLGISVNGSTVFTVATNAALLALQSAYEAADTTLQANITSEATTRANADTAISSSLTTLTATVNGHTSSISTNATAIATVDGKLSASYGLTVDANGRIASMKLLSNGTTSSVKFTASTFSIYDGTSDVAMFEVSGGAAYVAGSKVRTESLGANTVSSGVSDETDAAQLFDQTWTTIASVSVTTPDANSLIYLPFSMYVESVGFDATIAEARILRGATNIYQTDICGEPPTLDFETPVDGTVHYAPTFNGQVAGFDTDAPGAAGTYTYYLQVRTNGGGSDPGRYWSATKRRLFALLFKR